MIIFNVDLDNTLIYSYKHNIGQDKKCVEIYQGREVSFITCKTLELLRQLTEHITIVPTTTRTIEQFERIKIGNFNPEYALVCNGGVLLVDGEEDDVWYKESLQIVESCSYELEKAQRILFNDSNRCFELRNIKDLFVFTKSDRPDESMNKLKAELDMSLADVLCNGIKVYVVPKGLSKGNAVRRLRERLKADKVITSGDSEFDISMLSYADEGIAPVSLGERYKFGNNVKLLNDKNVFSEELLKYILKTTVPTAADIIL